MRNARASWRCSALLGASPGQVLSSVLLEAVIVGLVGSVLGIVGLGIAVLLQGLLAAFGIDLPSTSPSSSRARSSSPCRWARS
ncbi:MAG: hypothetical protein U0V56_04365 [Actinomycetota bacterium]